MERVYGRIRYLRRRRKPGKCQRSNREV